MKLGSLFLARVIAVPHRISLAQQASETPFTATGAFLALSVSDVAASARWYRDKLGLRVVLEPPRSNDATVIVLEGGGLDVDGQLHRRLGALEQGEHALHPGRERAVVARALRRRVLPARLHPVCGRTTKSTESSSQD